MREKILEILQDIRPDVDFETETKLIDNNILDSFDIISIVSELSDAFEVEIDVDSLVPENFNSVDSLEKLITALKNN